MRNQPGDPPQRSVLSWLSEMGCHGEEAPGQVFLSFSVLLQNNPHKTLSGSTRSPGQVGSGWRFSPAADEMSSSCEVSPLFHPPGSISVQITNALYEDTPMTW
ncbi:hypothetical protein ANANG_G00306900 [Anguilla anguilla]|uniref:Uncharacterized protein n=1 Tax=Anguilla anguilla TaxID=7936 RepID=A0A9D3RIN2_ANGAN|nr:hypothetical protein ANANG_G00306900 [Anguilla anguilla]